MKDGKLVFYIDPQSAGNLSAYDYGVLSEVSLPVVYVCSRYYDYKEMGGNIRITPIFSYNRISNPLLKLLSYLWSMIRLFWMIARKRPAIIHIQWLRVPHFDYMFYWLVKHLFKLMIIFTAHNVLPHNTGNRYKGIYRKMYRLVSHIIVHADATRKEIQEDFGIEPDKFSVIHHGTLKMSIDSDELKRQEAAFKQKYPTEGKIVFTSLGEQSPYKGIDLLVDIWKDTPELNNNGNLQIIFAGKNAGIDFSPISGFKNVTIVDERISNEEYFFLLHQAEVYLLPYRKISQSGALFTAMEEHVPMLVSDAGGLAEPLEIAEVGWKVKANDKDSLREKLLWLAAHPDDIKKVRNNTEAWQRVCDNYSWDTISRQTQALYDMMNQ